MIRIGIVATNQIRKDWGLAAAVCAGIAERLKGDVRFWWHCDVDVRHWNLLALVADYQLGELVEITHPPVDDRWMASQYLACDLTILPSSGEGWGYPAFESLACGTPCVTGSYAATGSIYATWGLSHLLVEPVAWRLEGQHNCLRPVYRAEDFVNTVLQVLEQHKQMEIGRDAVSKSVEHLAWSKLGPSWRRWFREGL